MIYNLEPKVKVLPFLLGNIDLLDISYVLQTESNTSYNSLLLCTNMNLLSILYKYDQYSPSFETDWTEVGHMECISFTAEYLSDNFVKMNVVQKFIRCFSFYKEKASISCTDSCNVNNGTAAEFISLYPKLFLDTENTELNDILTNEERVALIASNLLSVEFVTQEGPLLPAVNTIASKGIVLPSWMDLFTFVDIHINYPRKAYNHTDAFNAENHELQIWNDGSPGEDKYSSYSKSFNVVNDSTIILEFEFYVNLKQFKYLLDINDININYHINVKASNIIQPTGNFELVLYETFNDEYFIVNDIIYIKDIYTDSINLVCRIINITNNTLTLSTIWTSYGANHPVTDMDKFLVGKIKNLENFNTIQQNNIINNMINKSLFVINDIEFTDDDYLAINNLG